jgi:hypothetical protein
MYGDFSRVLDTRSGQYSGVLAQQGRFLLDAELNEQTAIVLDYLRHLTTDLIGPFAGPAHRAGFAVTPVFDDKVCQAFQLGGGHYYVYGIRCEAPTREPCEDLPINEHDTPFVAYIVVWEQSVNAIQAPELVEPALGLGVADTSLRSQIRWRPQAARHLPGTDVDLTACDPAKIVEAFHEHNADPLRRPRLGARAHATAMPGGGPSTAPTAAAYRGIENQLYRAEVHRGGAAGDATFKWSRDNGSVALALDDLSNIESGRRTATLQSVWRDAGGGLQPGDWVELVDDGWAPFGTPDPLMRVEAVSLATREVKLADGCSERVFDGRLHPFLRRWDQSPDEPAAGHGIPVADAEGQWYELEDGVQVQFEAHDDHYFQRGDFWLIPARTTTRGVLWPLSDEARPQPLALPPHGPTRYRAPLALITSPTADPVDLRIRFGHANEPDGGSEESLLAAVQVDDPGRLSVILEPELGYRLVSVGTFAPDAVFDVLDSVLTLGREADNDIHIDHPDVSRHHLTLTPDGERLLLEDLGSSNGTFVNGERIEEVTEIQPGDVITVGPDEVQLRLDPA